MVQSEEIRGEVPILRRIVLFVAVAAVLPAAEGGGDAVVGLWRTPSGENGAAIVKIVRKGTRYEGTIVWLEKPLYGPGEERPGQPKVDLNNPDPKLQERPVIGLEILHGFVWNGKKHRWEKGTIYDPGNGKTYKRKMEAQDPDTLKVRGFMGFSLLGRTEIWHRVTEIPGDAEDDRRNP